MSTVSPFLRRMRIAGILVLAGLLIEVITLFWQHHLAFVLFLVVGGLLIVAGIVLYLVAISSRRHGMSEEPTASEASSTG